MRVTQHAAEHARTSVFAEPVTILNAADLSSRVYDSHGLPALLISKNVACAAPESDPRSRTPDAGRAGVENRQCKCPRQKTICQRTYGRMSSVAVGRMWQPKEILP